ncbi:Nucleotidylyl transferase [Periconia macrospinosa]|uniref:Nucleotidylyl transferase n=1 Tax=Periconia macrospinosa TaxID=97972 RepID=A0A2V1EC35_9PLEO|nr:Nucleotidylyl transferase [Periconia macrospinosa]
MSQMPSLSSSLRSLLPDFEAALHSFTSSSSKFRVVRTINPTSTKPKTLYILDSSFNPPSKAHFGLVNSAIRAAKTKDEPFRVLLLFSTHNADKAPSPASFQQRIALMAGLGEDIFREWNKSSSSGDENTPISIDVGLTTEPYYTDKSMAIAESKPPFYESTPRHVHLVGYDTLIRLCNAKYYPKHSPPLSALAPFFDAGHGLRVTARPYDESDESSKEYGTLEAQRDYVMALRQGRKETEGFKSEWGYRVELVEDVEGVGISSTRVRKAAKNQEWDVVRSLCTETVSDWLQDQGLYSEDAEGKKMMS